ncbi:MAG TPA: DUF881 domain-containing protein [Candidatus Limnocylindrales bacterium]|nr:DUF881 domain-containing protein [Candidatus Limnocylindrales bacterium]
MTAGGPVRPETRARARTAMRDRRSQATIAAVACLLGLLVVVQLRGQAGGSALATKSAQDLTTLVANLNTENDRLRTEVANLQNQLAELRADRAVGATSVGQLESDLRRIRAWTGLDPVAGRGVSITVSGEIDAGAVEDLLNELRNAGAEAIAIEDIRVIARTTIGGVPGSLDVDGILLRDPFTVQAIGRPEALVGSLTRVGGIIAQVSATNPGATLEVEPVDRPMTLPATKRDVVPDHGQPRL